MCGIFMAASNSQLIINYRNNALLQVHRGPDSFGEYYNHNKFLYMAHNRLNIIDLTNNSNQPLKSHCGRFIMIFNGEIYNYQELKEMLSKDKKNWKSSGDGEVLLELWSRWQDGCLNLLNGMFSFIVYDKFLEKVSCVRDRYGIKPMYYMKDGDIYVFASDIRTLISTKKDLKPNLSSVDKYLRYGMNDDNENTFFEGIFRVKPGHLTEISLNTLEFKELKWYNLNDNLYNIKGNRASLIRNLDELLENAVHLYTISDVDFGINLSGGVDSTLLYTYMSNQTESFDAYTLDFDGYSERQWINKYFEKGRLNVINNTEFNTIGWFTETMQYQSEPYGGVMVLAYNNLYNEAKAKNTKVMLDGNGVDEVFLGYPKYQKFLSLEERDFKNDSIDGSNPVYEDAILLNKFKDNELTVSHRNVRECGVQDLLRNKLPRGLRYFDNVSMKYSIELRSPFLDHRLVHLGCSLDSNLLIDKSNTKLIIRELLEKRLSNHKISYAKKRSVQSPQREWVGGQMGKLMMDTFKSRSFNERGWIDPRLAVEQLEGFAASTDKAGLNANPLWQWLSLEHWARMYFD